MRPLLIYIPQDGVFFKEVLDAVVTLLSTSTFKSAIDIMLILAVAMMGYQYVAGNKLQVLGRYVLVSFLVTYAVLGMRVPVAIIDMQEAAGAGHALTVDHVPLGLALPASVISGLGYGITQVFSDVFHMPNDLDYNKSGMIFGSRTWLAATNARLTASPELAADVSAYLRQCVLSAKVLGSGQISMQALVNSPQLIKTYFEAPSPIYRVVLRNGKNVSCSEAAINIKQRLVTAAHLELTRLGRVMTKGDTEKYESILQNAHDYYRGISTSAADQLTQNILINATRDAASDAFAFAGADAALMNYTNTTSMQKMHIAEANTFWLASYRLPYFMTIMLMLTICIFPLVVLLAFLPLTQSVYVFYLQSQAYLWSWPPMFIIIHFLVSLAGNAHFTHLGQKTGGVTFANIEALASQHSAFAYTAGALAASVPFLAYYITKGLSSVLSNASQHFGGMVQSVSVSEAGSAAQGNVSMASYSGWNMNYDNTNAHKFDTNAHHAEGRSTMQMGNGALLSRNADGSTTGNIQPAISSAAVSVHGSDRVVESLHQSATESFSNATQHRTAADSHLQAGLSQMKQFTESDANDYRGGAGVSNTTSASIGQDLRIMKDAVAHHNKHSDNSHHTSAEEALSVQVNSNRSILGKGVQWVSGASGHVSLTGRNNDSHNTSNQTFQNTSEGKAFSDAYHHMIATAKTNHLDAADSHNLSKSEQIAANFSAGDSLMKQSSAEYAHGHQLQTAATHATEQAQSIDANLNQAYHDWVVQHYPEQGEQVMLKADSASIATQQQWANEFLNSSTGRGAVGLQVQSALAHTKTDIQQDYQAQAASISKTSKTPQAYQKANQAVDTESLSKGHASMTPEQLAAARDLQTPQRPKQVVEEGAKVEQYAARKIKHTEIKNKEK